MTNRTAHIPAGFELVNDTPMHRYRRIWSVGHRQKAQRPNAQDTRRKRSDHP